MNELTVKFQLDDDMFAELEELQQGFHEWKNKDGEYPFKDFSLEKTFNAVMTSGSKTYVREKINYGKFQIGLIDRDTYIKKVSEILTPEEKSPVPPAPAQMEKAYRHRKPELFSQANYADLEYKYKFSQQIDVDGRLDVKLALDIDLTLDILEPAFEIIQKNNLQKAYLIHSNYEVTELEIDDMENTLKTDWRRQVYMNTASLEANGVQYYYEFILMEGLDESIELYLLYSRSGETDVVGIGLVSGVEIVELEKAHSGDKKYVGERILADKYYELLQNCEKYIM